MHTMTEPYQNQTSFCAINVNRKCEITVKIKHKNRILQNKTALLSMNRGLFKSKNIREKKVINSSKMGNFGNK